MVRGELSAAVLFLDDTSTVAPPADQRTEVHLKQRPLPSNAMATTRA